ncbi:hypothetical protein TNIN_294291 [Trichonephila inaurata madagascariensis]|uniref:Uncharacterized protein n=1 Tax=Trichonephila inaurata madagascariensis TaxID=2747483 RepID=A0A8X7CBJ7_9ARAC|nr:hypothetical protein TNIN_294291 [Trichonephila inaurata madagascariensis]
MQGNLRGMDDRGNDFRLVCGITYGLEVPPNHASFIENRRVIYNKGFYSKHAHATPENRTIIQQKIILHKISPVIKVKIIILSRPSSMVAMTLSW